MNQEGMTMSGSMGDIAMRTTLAGLVGCHGAECAKRTQFREARMAVTSFCTIG